MLNPKSNKVFNVGKSKEVKLESSNLGHDELMKVSEKLGKTIEEIQEKELRWLELDELMSL